MLSAYPLHAITLGNNLMAACLGEAALAASTAAGAPAVDVAQLHATFAALAEQVRACFARHVGEIDG